MESAERLFRQPTGDGKTKAIEFTPAVMNLISRANGNMTLAEVKVALLTGHSVYTNCARYFVAVIKRA